MINPFRFRPAPGGLDWENNKISNAMAYFSQLLVPKWCQSEEHWTAKVFNYFWAECGCCLLFRGITVGFLLGTAISAAIALLL